MRSLLLLFLAFVILSTGAVAQTAVPTLYVQPTEDGFHTYISAAIHKKKVPVVVVTKAEDAAYALTAASVEIETVTTGKRLVNCLFAYCAGIEDKASTSVTLTDGSGAVVWSYSVNKGRGAKNRQSMAEAIAKHLKDGFERLR
jgi:hypothetical protein